MNRAHTVWLDQLSNTDATSLPASEGDIALPVFTLTDMPKRKRDMVLAVLRFVWQQRGRLVCLYLAWRLMRKLHALSNSQQDAPFTPLSHAALYPALTGDSSTPAAATSTATGGGGSGGVSLELAHATLFPAFIQSESTGVWLFTRAWRVAPSVERGRIFLLHGYREHCGRYQPLIDRWNEAGYSVYGMDQQGHGQSGGARGYVESFRHYLVDTLAWMEHVMTHEAASRLGSEVPIFIYGGTMGALLALQVARSLEWRHQAEEADAEEAAADAAAAVAQAPAAIAEEEAWEEATTEAPAAAAAASSAAAAAARSSASTMPAAPSWRVHGLILASPVLIPSRSQSPWMEVLASALADIVPRWGFTTLMSVGALSREPSAREQFRRDPLVHHAAMPVRFGHELLEAMTHTRNSLDELTLPVIIVQGSADRIVSPLGATYAIDHIASADKTLRVYDGAMHDLYLDDCRHQLADDLITWLNRQTQATTPDVTETPETGGVMPAEATRKPASSSHSGSGKHGRKRSV